MKLTFVVDINYDDQYQTICNFVKEPQCSCNLKVLLLKDQRAKVGDSVFFRCLHYWYKGIAAKGTICEIIEDNYVDVRFDIVINPKEHPFLSIAELGKVLPNKEWNDRYTHIELNDDEAQVLNETWELFCHDSF